MWVGHRPDSLNMNLTIDPPETSGKLQYTEVNSQFTGYMKSCIRRISDSYHLMNVNEILMFLHRVTEWEQRLGGPSFTSKNDVGSFL